MHVNTVAPPSEDKRWRIVGATMRKHGFTPDALIETLHSAQEAFGFLDDIALYYVAQSLGVPLSRVYGVATFYNLFNLKPQGAHTCVVCLGTACYIKGGPQILSALEDATGIHKGETTSDKQVSLMIARCLGACGLAPACVFDGEVAGKIEPDEAVIRLKDWTQNEPG
ncbi:MAG: bidirectional hydrogenase complex protein HoxE [Anaerolineae bacterium]|nr:bidirectional hydrogenase complex protein HoxE [Anaerolineae bacterium]